MIMEAEGYLYADGKKPNRLLNARKITEIHAMLIIEITWLCIICSI